MSYYVRWPRNANIPLFMTLVNADGTGATGKAPQVSIRRHHGVLGALDNHFWNGGTFQAGVHFFTMVELDAVNAPGVYYYLFQNSLISLEQTYLIYGKHDVDPKGRDSEMHICGRELPPVGVRLVTVRLQTAGAVRIPEANVSLYASDNVTFLAGAVTDMNGEATFVLFDGSYRLRLSKSLTNFTVPETLTVTGDQTSTFIGASFTPSVPAAPNLCTVFGTILDASGKAVDGLHVDARALLPQDVGGAQLGERLGTAYTNGSGYFEIQLVRGTKVRFKVEGTGFDFDRTVPQAASQDITTWDT